MKKFILILFLASIFFPKTNFACQCLGDPVSFCEDIFGENGEVYANFIVRATVTNQLDFSTTVKVNSTIYGENIDQDEILIGFGLCDGPGELLFGKEYIIALSYSSFDSVEYFFKVQCSISILEIENGVVKGKIASGVESANYSDLKLLEGCGNGFGTIFSLNDLTIFPNPTLGALEINTSGAEVSMEKFQLEIFDLAGRKLTNHLMMNGILEEEGMKINIENFSSGVYMLKFSDGFQEYVHRIVKVE